MKNKFFTILLIFIPCLIFSQNSSKTEKTNEDFLPVQFIDIYNGEEPKPELVKKFQEKGLKMRINYIQYIDEFGRFEYTEDGKLYILDTLGNVRKAPENYFVRAVLKNGNLIVASSEKNYWEVSYYGGIKIIDPNNNVIPTKSDLSNYVAVTNMGQQTVNYRDNTYMLVVNPVTSRSNMIDNNGSLIFGQDFYGLHFLFDDFVLCTENGVNKIYQLSTKKYLNIDGYEFAFVDDLKYHKLFELQRKTDNKYCLYDPYSGKIVLENEEMIFPIRQQRTYPNKATPKDFFLVYVDSDNCKSCYQIIDKKGRIAIPYVGKDFIFGETRVKVFDKGGMYDNGKYNIYDLEKKEFLYPYFVKEIKETEDFKFTKKDEFFIVINKKTNEQIYDESDRVKGYTIKGNMYLFQKQVPKYKTTYFPDIEDIYSLTKSEFIYRNTRGISYIDKAYGNYYIVVTNHSTEIIVDKNGNVVVPERTIINGKVTFNSAAKLFEVSNRKGKVIEKIDFNGNTIK